MGRGHSSLAVVMAAGWTLGGPGQCSAADLLVGGVVEDWAMSCRKFREDDAGYLAWLAAHPDGYVINIARSYNPTDARVHHAGCWTISRQMPHGGKSWTGPWVKVCAEDLAELEKWAIDQVREPIRRCGICHAGPDTGLSISTKQPEPAPAGPVSKGRCEVHGPTPARAVVEAWTDHYIRYPPRPLWQDQLVTEINTWCRQLEPSAGQVLHAQFFGTKRANADVENLALYNMGTFPVAGRNGIRFELGDTVPPAPDGGQFRFSYRYALAPRSGAFIEWQPGRTLASFDWTDLGSFAGEKKAAQVWLALTRGEAAVAEPACATETPFAVKVHVRPPHGRPPVWGGLVKGIFDGVISAFQTHTDGSVLPDVAARIAAVLPADPAEIAQRLLDRRRAVLGVVPQLVSRHRDAGIQWNPGDHLCVAGELLPAEPAGPRWAIKGEIVELSR